MNALRTLLFLFGGAATFLTSTMSSGQVVINEFLVDEKTEGFSSVHPSTREFLEIYNPGPGPVDISNWTLKTIEIGARFNTANGVTTYTIPASTSIPANDYFVIGHTGVSDVDFAPTPALLNAATPTPAPSGDLFPDGLNGSDNNFVFELRNSTSTLIDAVAVETFRGTERANITAEQMAFTGGGMWGESISANVTTTTPIFNTRYAVGRYQNGVRTEGNGFDFGFLPETRGASNNLPEVSNYTVPDVEALAVETPLGNAYGLFGSFKVAQVADPADNDGNVNQKQITAPPVGTKAIMAYDNMGGGNVVYSKSLINSFDIYAYIDTDQYNLLASNPSDTYFAEQTTYGIGTTDPLFRGSNSTDLFPDTSTRNGSAGVGWQIHKVERAFAEGTETRTILQLLNFADGGDSIEADGEWDIIAELDLTDEGSDWHRLAIDYNPATGMVSGRYDDQVFEFEYSESAQAGDFNFDGTVNAADYVAFRKTGAGAYADFEKYFGESGGGSSVELVGTFYAGYRDFLDDSGGTIHYEVSRPATFLQYEPVAGGSGTVPEPASFVLAAMALAGAVATRRSRG